MRASRIPNLVPLFVVLFFPTAGFAADASARPTQALVLADFETPDALANWTGIERVRAEGRAVSGRFGMKFAIPKWDEGQEPRPGVRLAFNLGLGFPSQDFSRYGAVAVDAWVEGDQPGKLGLKLRDEQGDDSWTTHIAVEPGRWNPVLLPIDEASADCEVRHVAEVVLYALRPTNGFTLVLDNLRLLPRDPPPVARFDLRYPNYRNWIFPAAGDIEVECQLEANEHVLEPRRFALQLELQSKTGHRSARAKFSGATGLARVRTDGLPAGDLTLEARVVQGSGAELAKQQWSLRQLTPAQVAQLKVYVDRHNNLRVDGAPFFPVGWYGSVNDQHLAELADSPFNCLLAYGTDHVPKARMLRFLDAMQDKGLKLVYCLNDVYPTAEYFQGKTWEGISGNDAIAAAVVAAYREHPAVLAWYLNDELPHKLVPDLLNYYGRVQESDPSRPSFIVLCNRSELPYFPATTDVLGVDPYPIPHDPITRVSDFVDAARAAVRERQAVWLVPQAFAWYQYKSKNPDRGHIPSEDELQTGRAPTYEEERCMTYLGLIHGAKGLIYYCYYDLRVLPQYADMWAWLKSIATEVRQLTPALVSAEDAGPWSLRPTNGAVHAALKRHGNRLYLLAANPGKATCRVELDLRRRWSREVTVVFEGRRLTMQQGRFTDNFAPLAAHVYEVTFP